MVASHTPPPWRRAFLRELARSGSVALAARTVGIDRSSAYQARQRNPALAASWDRALATARERLAHSQPFPHAGGEGGHAQPKLRPDEIVRSSKAGRPCIVRVGPGRWSTRSERVFLDTLAATSNVKAAARAAGVSPQAAYNRRRLWPAFAEEWRAAQAEGWQRLELLLLRAATATLDPEPDATDPGEAASEPFEAPEMTVDQALNLYKLHRASQHGGKPQRYSWRRREPDIEDIRAQIVRKVAAIKRARG